LQTKVSAIWNGAAAVAGHVVVDAEAERLGGPGAVHDAGRGGAEVAPAGSEIDQVAGRRVRPGRGNPAGAVVFQPSDPF